jgi:hypothetical protein
MTISPNLEQEKICKRVKKMLKTAFPADRVNVTFSLTPDRDDVKLKIEFHK